jgi:putative addiction module killer protein
MRVVEYTTDDGASPFGRWFNRLEARAALKIRRAIAQLENSNWSNVKSVGSGVQERIVDFGPGYRVYFGQIGGDLVVLLGGGTKKRQQKDIDAAKEFWNHYKSRRRQGRQTWH